MDNNKLVEEVLDQLQHEQERKMYEQKLWCLESDKDIIKRIEHELHGDEARDIVFFGTPHEYRSLLHFNPMEYNSWEYLELLDEKESN